MYLRNVVTLKLDPDKCTGCEMCTLVCPHGVFGLGDHKAYIKEKDRCIECGACAKNCPFSAIEVKSGVGCAQAIIRGLLTGSEPTCDCSGSKGGCC